MKVSQLFEAPDVTREYVRNELELNDYTDVDNDQLLSYITDRWETMKPLMFIEGYIRFKEPGTIEINCHDEKTLADLKHVYYLHNIDAQESKENCLEWFKETLDDYAYKGKELETFIAFINKLKHYTCYWNSTSAGAEIYIVYKK